MDWIKQLKFDDKGLIPVIVQDNETAQVLMVAYMNKESLRRTVEEGKMCYWSRSRKKMWVKGETSGHFQYLEEIRIDCDADTLLCRVRQIDQACHTGHKSCFYRRVDSEGAIREDTDG